MRNIFVMFQTINQKKGFILNPLIIAIFLVTQSLANAGEAPTSNKTIWEYDCISLQSFSSRNKALEHFNILGSQGWEMATIGTIAKDGHTVTCFKRKK